MAEEKKTEQKKDEKREKVVKVFKDERTHKGLIVIGLLAFGALAMAVLGTVGIVNPVTIGKYGVWIIIGFMAIYIITTQTRTEFDNMVAGFLLLLSLGGVGAMYLIDRGMVGEGVVLLGSLFLVFIFLLIVYMKSPVLGVVKRKR
ncbi:MAG: hypothetical protein QW607_01940 [Desulfurococcaceae archaeon]